MNNTTESNRYRLLWAGFVAIFATGVGFGVRTGVLRLWAADYGFTMTELGEITGGGLWGFVIGVFLGSLVADKIGYGKLMILAFVLHVLSAVLQFCTDPIYQSFGDNGRNAVYWTLYLAMTLFAIGNGTCEAVVNPVVATVFPQNKTHYLNILHAGWPGGLITGGVISYLMNGGAVGTWIPLGNVSWLIQMSMFLIPVALYGLMILGQRFPKSEAGQAGVSFGTMLLQVASPLFLMLLLIQAMVGYVELGTDSWISKITGSILENPNHGMLLFIYTSGLMFVLRFFGGPLEHRFSPLGLLFFSAILGAIGLTLLGRVEGALLCVIAATIYALGKTFLWPTMLAVASERFPKGGAITIGAVGGIGMLSAGFLGGPGIGFKQDYYATEKLQETSPPTYERYKSDIENRFLTFKVQGLDGSRTNMLELATTLERQRSDAAATDLKSARKSELETDIKMTQREIDAQLKRPELAKWWTTTGEPHKDVDKKPVEEASLFGGRMALTLTAAVPAVMAVLYLLLILYFRMTGGYKKKVVLTTEAPGSEY